MTCASTSLLKVEAYATLRPSAVVELMSQHSDMHGKMNLSDAERPESMAMQRSPTMAVARCGATRLRLRSASWRPLRRKGQVDAEASGESRPGVHRSGSPGEEREGFARFVAEISGRERSAAKASSFNVTPQARQVSSRPPPGHAEQAVVANSLALESPVPPGSRPIRSPAPLAWTKRAGASA